MGNVLVYAQGQRATEFPARKSQQRIHSQRRNHHRRRRERVGLGDFELESVWFGPIRDLGFSGDFADEADGCDNVIWSDVLALGKRETALRNIDSAK